MKQSLFRRNVRLGRKSVIVTATSSVLAVTLGAWLAAAGSSHADDVPDPGDTTVINSEAEEILVIAKRPPRQPAPNAKLIDEDLTLDLDTLLLGVDLSRGVCPPGCDLTAYVVSQATLNAGFLRLNVENAFKEQGILLDNVELGLPDDPMFANWIADEGSNIGMSEYPGTVDNSPTSSSDYSVTTKPDGSGSASYYARAVVAGETSVSGNVMVFQDGRGAAGTTNTLSINSFMYLGQNAAGVTLNASVNVFGGDKTSLQAGKSAVQVGVTGKDANGHEGGVSASIAADGTAKVSVGVKVTAPGLPPLWVRGDFGVDKGGSISAPDAGVTINANGNATGGFGFGFDLKLDLLYNFLSKKTGSK